MQRLFRAALAAAVLTALAGLPARAEVKPHGLFSNGAVLQRDMPVPVWGTADPGEAVEVSVTHGGKAVGTPQSATADKGGNWRVTLPALTDAGDGYELKIKGKGSAVTVTEVLVGEVWVCGGQSNMEWPLNRSAKADEAAAAANNPNIRLFKVINPPSLTPQKEVMGGWTVCDPKTVRPFSAVGYYFGRDLQHKLGVPVGLIQNAWGGTPAEVWTSRKALEADPKLAHLVATHDQQLRDYPAQFEAYKEARRKAEEEALKAKAEGKKGPKVPQAPNDPKTFVYGSPYLLYNGRITTIAPYAIRGAIWYQGESNAGPFRAEEYATLFPAMIKNWRDTWQEGDFPFLFVQLAPFMDIKPEPADTPWAWLREAQRQTALHVPHTAMAVITDVGEEKDIHPQQKQPVGERLALAALALAYGQKVPYTGPVFDSLKVADGKAVITFKNADQGLEARGGELHGFTIAGKDGKFVNAKAAVQGNQVIVSSPDVAEPAAVRFGWTNFPVVNLWGKDGLPASPFRTDDFPPPWAKPKK